MSEVHLNFVLHIFASCNCNHSYMPLQYIIGHFIVVGRSMWRAGTMWAKWQHGQQKRLQRKWSCYGISCRMYITVCKNSQTKPVLSCVVLCGTRSKINDSLTRQPKHKLTPFDMLSCSIFLNIPQHESVSQSMGVITYTVHWSELTSAAKWVHFNSMFPYIMFCFNIVLPVNGALL